MATYVRKPFDLENYSQRVQTGPCFVCELLKGNNPHHIISEDDFAVAFLAKYQPLYGYILVSPREHREQVTNDFTLDEYLTIQKLIFRISEALRKVTSVERVYIRSLGSQQGNSHVHWHIAALPPGVPYEKQQGHALSPGRNGVLDIPEEGMAELARKIADVMGVDGLG